MNLKNIFFVGIKGVGMTALAIYCKERGFNVFGSDTEEVFQTDNLLRKLKIKVYERFKKDNINQEIDLVIYSGAYDIRLHPEVRQALESGIKIMSHGEALGKFMSEQIGISVAGTHGKTTSTALLATVLTQASLDPSYIIGAAGVNSLLYPGHFGKGKYFVAEADEYQTAVNFERKSRFLWQNPRFVIVTNIDYDHPDVFKNINEVKKVFKKFFEKIPKEGFLVYNGDDENINEVIKDLSCSLISFGEGAKNKYVLTKVTFENQKTKIKIRHNCFEVDLSLRIAGRHNALNVCGVYALAKELGLSDDKIKKAVESYTGCRRRLERKGENKGVIYYDDYAHHPTEIIQTIEAIRSWFKDKRLIVIFQPHTFSRTQFLASEFAKSFDKADLLILTDIFSSAREVKEKFNITGELFAEKIRKTYKKVYYAKTFSQVIKYVRDLTRRDDIVLTMGAGDIYKLHEILF